MKQLKGKKGAWVRPGTQGGDPVAPGSYGQYLYMRSAPTHRKTTSQQHKVGGAGRDVGAKCKGKKGAEFRKCRHEVMASVFGVPK